MSTEIIRAIKQGPHRLAKAVKTMQKKGHVVDNTALYEVLRANDIEAVKTVLSCPLFANIDDRHEEYDNETPLTYVMNMLETPHGIDYRAVAVQLLFSGKFDVNQRDRYGRTVLHVAAKLGIDCLVDLLLLTEGFNTDVNARVAYSTHGVDDWGKTALELALRAGRKSTVDRLLRDVVVTLSFDEEEGKAELHLRAIETDVQCVFSKAVNDSTIETVRLLLDDHRVDVNATLRDGTEHISPLHLAVLRGDEDICRVLLGHPGLDVNARATENETALHRAARKWHDGFVRILIEDPRTDVNALDESGTSPLMEAVRWGRVSVVETLLSDDRVDVNVVCEDEDEGEAMTPLRYATKEKRPGYDRDSMHAIVHLLVENPRTDVNVVDFQGRPLAFLAADRDDETLLKKIYTHPTMRRETTDSAEKKLLDMLRMLKRATTRGKCDFCGTGNGLKKCVCECARYCCKDHQNKDWKKHKALCRVIGNNTH